MRHLLIIDERPLGAAFIHHEPGASRLPPLQPGVPRRHRRVFQPDVVALVPANHNRRLVEDDGVRRRPNWRACLAPLLQIHAANGAKLSFCFGYIVPAVLAEKLSHFVSPQRRKGR